MAVRPKQENTASPTVSRNESQEPSAPKVGSDILRNNLFFFLGQIPSAAMKRKLKRDRFFRFG
jgi:hypothetical protein